PVSWKTSLPVGVVVSMACWSRYKSTPQASRCWMVSSKSLSERPRRSIAHAMFLRRLLAKQITSGDVSKALGRLQIRKHPQSVRLVTLSRQAGSRSGLGNALQVMTSAARTMLNLGGPGGDRPPRCPEALLGVAYAANE